MRFQIIQVIPAAQIDRLVRNVGFGFTDIRDKDLERRSGSDLTLRCDLLVRRSMTGSG